MFPHLYPIDPIIMNVAMKLGLENNHENNHLKDDLGEAIKADEECFDLFVVQGYVLLMIISHRITVTVCAVCVVCKLEAKC